VFQHRPQTIAAHIAFAGTVYGITEFPTPAGGCLLTDIGFSKRLKWAFNNKMFDEVELSLLKYGRHFIIDGFHTIIGRTKNENIHIEELISNNDLKVYLHNRPSPKAVIINGIESSEETQKKIAALTLRYSKFRDEKDIEVRSGKNIFLIERAETEKNFERII